MRAVWLEVPEWFLEERRQLGHDKKDEVWDGELHMVPPPTLDHSHITFELAKALDHIALRRGLRTFTGETGLFDPAKGVKNYRIPDVVVVRPEHMSKRGVEGAELVVEVLSPHDESRQKFAFYAARGVKEIWLVTPSPRAIEIYELRGGEYADVTAGGRSPLLGIDVTVGDGVLHLRDGDLLAEV